MIDISKKSSTLRLATAHATLRIKPSTLEAMKQGRIPKGDPLPVARVAAILAAKNTSQIIPYCHPLPVEFVECRFEVGTTSIDVFTEVKAIHKTGVEMEALAAASAAVLTLYDMMKALDDEMEIVGIKLLQKKGGKSDFTSSVQQSLKAAVLVSSDTASQNEKHDTSGKMIVDRLKREGFEVIDYSIVPDDITAIKDRLLHYCDTLQANLVLTTGGTGLSPRDNSPEATMSIVEKEIPGVAEYLRSYGQERMPFTMFSRGRSGLRGKTLVVNLPGSERAVQESLDALFPFLLHAFAMLRGAKH